MVRFTTMLTMAGTLAGAGALAGCMMGAGQSAPRAPAAPPLPLPVVAPTPLVSPPADTTTIARTELRDASGRGVGTAIFTRAGTELRVAVTATGLSPGVHGIHLHAIGKCTAPDFTSAGPHWNPLGKQHGKDNPAGMHDGDLPNITIGADGRGTLSAVIPGGARDGAGALMDADGASIVVHAKADDYRSDPAGNSGARIACGVLQLGG